MSNKEMRRIARVAKKVGCDVRRTNSGHYRIAADDGHVIVIPFSPGSPNSERTNIRMWEKFRKEHVDG